MAAGGQKGCPPKLKDEETKTDYCCSDHEPQAADSRCAGTKREHFETGSFFHR
jgi:hypothetical protein